MTSYWQSARSPLYSFLFTIPLFLLYEVGILFSDAGEMLVMRNGADALMRQALDALGVHGHYWIGGLFFVGFLIAYILQRKFWDETPVYGDYLLLMMGESVVWAVGIYYFMSNVYVLLMLNSGSGLIQQVTLAVGAGIYEEFLFRVLLIAGIGSILGFVFQWKKQIQNWVAMIIAAGIFSAFHFIGDYGDFFSFDIFMIRFFAGILLGILYFLRGFGIVAWSHSIYDLIVLTRVTTQ